MEYFTHLVRGGCVVDLGEHFVKRSERNRARILAADGVMELTVHVRNANRPRQPLLPLNVSQIGLVGASGMMNGLVECDTPHVIKGRIVKETKTKIGEENDCGKMEIREITSNKLVFNILTPQGYRSLG